MVVQMTQAGNIERGQAGSGRGQERCSKIVPMVKEIPALLHPLAMLRFIP
jgi:hypothetical protein